MEPTLKDIATKWHKDYVNLLKHLYKQEMLAEKYGKIAHSDQILNQFKIVENKSWQWLDHYKAAAIPLLPVDHEYIAQDSNNLVFDIDKSFSHTCREHAKAQTQFVIERQAAQLGHLKQKVCRDAQLVALNDAFTSWQTRYYPNQQVSAAKQILLQFADLTFRKEMPKIVDKIDKEKDLAAKRVVRTSHATVYTPRG